VNKSQKSLAASVAKRMFLWDRLKRIEGKSSGQYLKLILIPRKSSGYFQCWVFYWLMHQLYQMCW